MEKKQTNETQSEREGENKQRGKEGRRMKKIERDRHREKKG
jgi:hypothetical protein